MWIVILFVLFITTHAYPGQRDQITQLPGISKQPTFRHYAGYLNGSNTDRLFYWFVESQNDPVKDPLVLWLNGGPGCSSLNGFLTENGPFRVTPNSHLEVNKFSWNKIANILYLESPVCVGFSYSTINNCSGSDNRTALLNFNALKSFLVKFPQFKNRDFFINGESYAGYYIPTLAYEMVTVESKLPLVFKGIAIGNALSSEQINRNGNLHFAYNHALISDILWEKLLYICCGNTDPIHCDIYTTPSKECREKISEVTRQFSNINPYNIYQKCVVYSDDDEYIGNGNKYSKYDQFMMATGWMKPFYSKLKDHDQARLSSAVLPCTDTRPSVNYLNKPEVRKILHVNEVAMKSKKWASCDQWVNKHYQRDFLDMSLQYKELLSHKDIRIWIYNGDVDMVCSYLSEEWFFENFYTKRNAKTQQRPWHYQDETNSTQVAGFVQIFDNIHMITVKGSGHFVPTDTPIPAFKLFRSFLANQDLD